MYRELLLALISARVIEWLIVAVVKTYYPLIQKHLTKRRNGVIN
jgi:hypothetical protein